MGKSAELSLVSNDPSIDLILEAQLERSGEMESEDVGEDTWIWEQCGYEKEIMDSIVAAGVEPSTLSGAEEEAEGPGIIAAGVEPSTRSEVEDEA